MLPPIDWPALTEDELDALEEALNTEKKRHWALRRQPTLVEDIRASLRRESDHPWLNPSTAVNVAGCGSCRRIPSSHTCSR
jgi:hypothetical protein